MQKVKVPLNGQLFELASGRQLVPGEVVKLTADEAKENKERIEEGFEAGTLLDASDAKASEGGEK